MIRIGVIGAGDYGRLHLEALKQRQELRHDVALVGFAEISEARRAQIARDFGVPGFASLRELVETSRPDAVCVVTPDHLHYQAVMDCLKAGIHVLVEKPFATVLAEAKEMAREARRRNLLLQIDFHKRFDPYHIDLKMRVEQGELGQIQYGYCWIEDVLAVGEQMIGKKAWQNKGSPAWFLGIHMIDLTYWVMGMPKAVSAYAHGSKGKLTSKGIDTHDSIKAEVVYANGAVITYDTSVILPNSHEAAVRQGVKLVGTEGFMEVNSQYRGARGCSTSRGMETPNLGAKHRVYGPHNQVEMRGYLYESIYDFVENLKLLQIGKTVAELEGGYASPEQGIESTKVGVAIHESIDRGCVIDLTRW